MPKANKTKDIPSFKEVRALQRAQKHQQRISSLAQNMEKATRHLCKLDIAALTAAGKPPLLAVDEDLYQAMRVASMEWFNSLRDFNKSVRMYHVARRTRLKRGKGRKANGQSAAPLSASA